MFVIPGLAALFAFVYVRPHEVFELLQPFAFAPIVGIVAFGYLLDVKLGVARPRMTALFGLGLAYFVFATLDGTIKAPDTLPVLMPMLGSAFISFWVVTQSIKTFHGLEIAASVLLALTLLVAAVGVHQGFTPSVCYVFRSGVPASETDILDGRPCVTRDDCHEGGQPGTDYICEHPGLFGTHSIGGRVRYRGFLQDPNELSWAVGMGSPLAFALYERKRSRSRLFLLLLTLGLGALCTIMTQSRAGQLTFAAMLGVYFVRRFRWKGALGALLVSAPVLLLGGRSGSEADESTGERLEAWAEGLTMWRENPFLGVGPGQFTEHHWLTAHSSWVLTLAETGPIGLMLFTATVYAAFKVTIRAQSGLAGRPEATTGRAWATAVFASLTGTVISASFLSIPYKAILWISIGLAGAFYAAVRGHDPEFRVTFGLRDLAIVFGIDFAFVSFVMVYLRLKGI